MANKKLDVEMRSLTPFESFATNPISMQHKIANAEMNVDKGNEC